MMEKQVTLPTLVMVAGTRVALGMGVGLLLAGQLSPEQRRAAGISLLAVGALTTVPLLAQIFGADHRSHAESLRVERNPISPYVTASS